MTEVEVDHGLVWPDKPTCHGLGHRTGEPLWRPPRSVDEDDPYEQTYRSCSYCGCIHPEDLYQLLQNEAGVNLGGSDWKYGWPHKFYVDGIPNPRVGVTYTIWTYGGQGDEYQEYTRYDGTKGFRKPYGTRSAPPTQQAKWYNQHLDELERPTFEVFSKLLDERTGVRFFYEDGKLKYQAPYQGYQR